MPLFPAPLRRLLFLLGSLYLMLFQAGLAVADPVELFPWRAEYRASYRAGIPIRATAVRELKQQENGTWLYNFDVDSMFLKIKENTLILWQNDTIVPLQYSFRRSGWIKSREAYLDFDWQKKKVRNDVQKKPWIMEIPEGTQDKLSYQLQMHMDLIAGKKHMIYNVADGGVLKEFEFAVKGQESLDTALGNVATIYVDKVREPDSKRFTRLWFAKDWKYLLVKMIQKEEDGEVYEISLIKARVGDQDIK